MASNSVTVGCALIPCFESDDVHEQAVSPASCQICMGLFSDSHIEALIHTVRASPDFWLPVCCLYTTPDGLPTKGLIITMMSVCACCPLQRVRHCFSVSSSSGLGPFMLQYADRQQQLSRAFCEHAVICAWDAFQTVLSTHHPTQCLPAVTSEALLQI